jgi:hypothetical protein
MWIVFTVAVATCAAAEPQLHGAASALLPAPEPAGPAKTIHVRPRYVRLYTDPGVELAAANYQASREIIDALAASGKRGSGGDQHNMDLRPNVGSGWKCVMTRDERRRLIAGSPKELRAAIGRGADL